MKTAVCISCTHHYGERIAPIQQVLQAAGYTCTYITSDFHHTSKKPHKVDLPHCIQIPTLPYQKNISVQRIVSHMRFARDTFRQVRKLKPDLLYVEVPPNSLCREAARYRKKHPHTRLILDIFDLWPESFPSNRLKKLLKLPFGAWAWVRNCGLPGADLVLTECDLFREKLQKHLKDTPTHTLYLCREKATCETPVLPEQGGMHLCYLGSINNIIDIPTISALIGEIGKILPVTLHIIGDGESRDAFIAAVEAAGAQVIFHGKIYDGAQKQAIFDRCSFGLNIMKDSVCIGLTMKSLDYFAGGLPILNTIGGDTERLVNERCIGINLDRENPANTARLIADLDSSTHLQMRNNTIDCFRELFSKEVFSGTLKQLL